MELSNLPIDEIRTFGDPVLKQQARQVTDFGPELKQLTELMFAMMERADGVGLAAPQIGVERQVVVYMNPETESRHILINPRIVERSDELQAGSEGCLSIPGRSMEVPRAERVVVEAQDLEGAFFRFEAEGILARIMQHEIDHLQGHLILDRTPVEERRRVLRELRENDLGV